MTEQERIAELEDKIAELEGKVIDLTFESNYNKQDELLEFVQDLYLSLQNVDEKLEKQEIIENLKKYVQNFARDNNIQL